jgi:hypothetical protein
MRTCRRETIQIGLTSLLVLGMQAVGFASGPREIERLDKMSHYPVIFAGTVDSVEYGEEGHASVTRVRFASLDSVTNLKGDGSVTLTLNRGLEWPSFQKSSRYVVFARNLGEEPWFMPNGGEGFFRVRTREAGTYVCAPGDRPVVEIDSGLIGVLDERLGTTDSTFVGPYDYMGRDGRPGIRRYSKRSDPGTRVTEAEFLTAVRELRRGN